MNQQPIMQPQKPAVNKWLWITLIIVIIAAGAFATWYFLSGPGKTSTESATTTTPKTTTTDKTAGWKTYENKTYGVSFKYPKDWTVSDKIQVSGIGGDDDVLEISAKDGQKLSVWVNQDGFGLEGASMVYDATITNNKIVVNKKTENKENPTADQAVITKLKNDNDVYAIAFNYIKAKKTTDLETFDTILSTFKFTK